MVSKTYHRKLSLQLQKYVIIPWEKFDDLVGEETNNFFLYNSSRELV